MRVGASFAIACSHCCPVHAMSEDLQGDRPRPPHAPAVRDDEDPVLADIGRMEAHYDDFRTSYERLRAELERAQRGLERQRREAERSRRRAEDFRVALKDIQRSLFRGDTFLLVLQSCVRLCDATRGIYVAATAGGLRVRAAINVDGYASQLGAPPSDYLAALVRRVLELDDTVVCGDPDAAGLPKPEHEWERFRGYAAVPVAVRGDIHGVVVVADKRNGGAFDEEDVETLLHVGDQASVAVDNARLHHELERTYLATVGMLADAVEIKDAYTGGHCERVSHLARLTAERLELDAETCHTVCLAALLHDVGKIGVSDGILNKPGPLLPEERELVKSHARIGHDLLQRLPALRPVSHVVLHHHEAYDGRGYPDALSGDAIPIGARIVAVIDAYCAMVDRRSYKNAMTEAEATAELRRCAGTQFDPAVVEAVLAVLASPEGRSDGRAGNGMPNCGFLTQSLLQ